MFRKFGTWMRPGRESGNGLRTLERSGECECIAHSTGQRTVRGLWILLLAAHATMTWGVGDASAQAEATEAPEAAAAADTVQIPIEDEHKALEEIVVTADRRESNIQDVAASVSAFNEQDLLAQGLLNVNDVQFNVPSFFSGSGLTRVTARGIGSEIVGPGV
ncbi:MAG: hypothetical protein JRH17_23830, partial [Deltaproteobacteria bacterium]|nr:hypothetical protein [Deltaproteobacteria bacterium]